MTATTVDTPMTVVKVAIVLLSPLIIGTSYSSSVKLDRPKMLVVDFKDGIGFIDS